MMDNEQRCPCGRNIGDIIELRIKQGGVCPDHYRAEMELKQGIDINSTKYIFDCYKTSREKFKKEIGEDKSYTDPRKIMCDYRYILFNNEKEAVTFYNKNTYDVGQRVIVSLKGQAEDTLWLVRFIDKVEPLMIANISGFISHERLEMFAGALSDSIGIETTILPRYKGKRGVSHSKSNWNDFCNLLSKLDVVQEYCAGCTLKINNLRILQKDKLGLKNQEPLIYYIEDWCGLIQIAVPIKVNNRWIATAVSGGLWNNYFSFDKFLKNLQKNENTYKRFKKELTLLKPEDWSLEEGENLGFTFEERIEKLRKIYKRTENSKIFNPQSIDEYKKNAKKFVLNIQDVLEERYASIRQTKNEYWMQRLILDWEKESYDSNDLWCKVYKKFLLQMEEYGQFKKSYLFINKPQAKTYNEEKRTFKIFSKGESIDDFKLPDNYKVNDRFFTEPIKIYHITEFERDVGPPEDRKEYELIKAILKHINRGEKKIPEHCAALPLVLSKEDKRYGIVIFLGRSHPRPLQLDKKSFYIRDLLQGFRRSFLDRVKISYEETKRQQSYEAQKTFLDFLNHEIAITLSFWNGSLQWIEKGLRKKFHGHNIDTFTKRIEDQRQQAFQLNKLIADLALINILNEGELKIDPKPVNLLELIKTATHMYAGDATRKFMNFNFGTNLRILVKLDKGYMERVFGNLVRNAIQYGYKETEIKFQREDTIDNIYIEVVSYGIPVEKEFEEKIFARGFRSPNAKEYCTGTGYGLWLSREILRAHGRGFNLFYQRSIHSGNETTFVIKIPKEHIINEE